MDNMMTYVAVYNEAKTGMLHHAFLTVQEKKKSIEEIKKRLPEGYVLLSEDVRDFSQLLVHQIDSPTGIEYFLKNA